MKLVVVLVLAVIFVGPTVAKMFSKQEAPTRRGGLLYRMIRRYGLIRVGLAIVFVVVILPTVLWVYVRP